MLTSVWTVLLSASMSLAPSICTTEPPEASGGKDASVAAAAPAAQTSSRWSGTIELPGGQKLAFNVDLSNGSGTIDIPMQGAKGLKLEEVTTTDRELKFTLTPPGASDQARAKFAATIAEDGQSATGTLSQVGMEFPVTMKRLADGESAADESLKRPQTPKEPFPYKGEEVSYTNTIDGTQLGGTLTIPDGAGPHPAVIMITGSGPQDRDEALMGHRPFWVIADHFSRAGVAVLRVDDRGVGASTGSIRTSTSEDFAGDVLAGVEFLKTRTDIDPKHIGLVGHSEGGLIAPIVAAKSSDVAFIVLMAGTGMSGADLLPIQERLIYQASGLSEEAATMQANRTIAIYDLLKSDASDESVIAKAREIGELELADQFKDKPVDEAARRQAEAMVEAQAAEIASPWFRYFIKYEPATSLRKVHCPVLAINGSLDLQVPPRENLPRIEQALKEGGNTDITIVELEGLNHLFQTATTGGPDEYAVIEETISPKALETMTTWIRKRAGLDR